MRSTTSPQIGTFASTKASSVGVTTPSVVFSTGTTASSARPLSTAATTSGRLGSATKVGRAAELLAGGQMAERALGAEEGHAQGTLETPRDADDLAEYMGNRSGRERSGVERGQALQDLALSRGVEGRDARALLEAADFEHDPGTLVQAGEDRVVDGVDAVAQLRERRGGIETTVVGGTRLRAVAMQRSGHSLLPAGGPARRNPSENLAQYIGRPSPCQAPVGEKSSLWRGVSHPRPRPPKSRAPAA